MWSLPSGAFLVHVFIGFFFFPVFKKIILFCSRVKFAAALEMPVYFFFTVGVFWKGIEDKWESLVLERIKKNKTSKKGKLVIWNKSSWDRGASYLD